MSNNLYFPSHDSYLTLEILPVNINLNMIFTEQALARLKNTQFSFKAPRDLQLIPAIGDTLSFPGLESFSFIVLNKHWEYGHEESINITYLLDLVSEENRTAKLSIVE